MNLDKYIEDSKKTGMLLIVLIDGDKVVHTPIHRSLLSAPKGLEVVFKSLRAMMGNSMLGKVKNYKCIKCGKTFTALSPCNAKCTGCGYKHKCDEAIEIK